MNATLLAVCRLSPIDWNEYDTHILRPRQWCWSCCHSRDGGDEGLKFREVQRGCWLREGRGEFYGVPHVLSPVSTVIPD